MILHAFPTSLKAKIAFERAIFALPEDEETFVNSTTQEIVTKSGRHLFRVVAGMDDCDRLRGFEFEAISLYPGIPEPVAQELFTRLRGTVD